MKRSTWSMGRTTSSAKPRESLRPAPLTRARIRSLRQNRERFLQELRERCFADFSAELLDRAIGLALAVAHVDERAREEIARRRGACARLRGDDGTRGPSRAGGLEDRHLVL